MAEYWSLINKISLNPFMISQEELLWSLQHLCQQLLDINLVKQEDLKLKNASKNFFQKFLSVPNKILDCKGDWEQIQKNLACILPVTSKCWWYTNIKKQDWVVLQSEKLTALHASEFIAVPKFRIIPDNYR